MQSYLEVAYLKKICISVYSYMYFCFKYGTIRHGHVSIICFSCDAISHFLFGKGSFDFTYPFPFHFPLYIYFSFLIYSRKSSKFFGLSLSFQLRIFLIYIFFIFINLFLFLNSDFMILKFLFYYSLSFNMI